jgi:quercetin dioxygenase-like cupin family protein
MITARAADSPARPVTASGSTGVSVSTLARSTGASVSRVELDPGGCLAMHPAGSPQLFVVVSGEGTVATDQEQPEPVEAGSAVWWHAGELHETRSETGLVALVVEAAGLEPEFT